MTRIHKLPTIALAAVLAVGLLACGKDVAAAPPAEAPATTAAPAEAPTTTAAPAPAATLVPPTASAPDGSVTVSQQQAAKSAEHYLKYQSFSRSGLVSQLLYEGFSAEDAEYGVSVVTVDWNEQAAKSAAHYLKYQSFSASGLTDQLVYEGFTAEQAAYGVSTTGL
jgi:hypothetical protein